MTDFTYLILVKGLLLILTQKKKKKGLAFNVLCYFDEPFCVLKTKICFCIELIFFFNVSCYSKFIMISRNVEV